MGRCARGDVVGGECGMWQCDPARHTTTSVVVHSQQICWRPAVRRCSCWLVLDRDPAAGCSCILYQIEREGHAGGASAWPLPPLPAAGTFAAAASCSKKTFPPVRLCSSHSTIIGGLRDDASSSSALSILSMLCDGASPLHCALSTSSASVFAGAVIRRLVIRFRAESAARRPVLLLLRSVGESAPHSDDPTDSAGSASDTRRDSGLRISSSSSDAGDGGRMIMRHCSNVTLPSQSRSTGASAASAS